MSASPAGAPGPTPNGARPPPTRRRKPVVNPLVSRNPQPRRKPSRPPQAPGAGAPIIGQAVAPPGIKANGALNTSGSNTPRIHGPSHPPPPTTALVPKPPVDDTDPPGYTDYPVVATKRAMLEGLRHHVMRLNSKIAFDILDEKEFTRPIRLHRRDPRSGPSGAGANPVDVDVAEDEETVRERERLEAMKAERRRQREENMKQVAPSKKPKHNAFQKKTKQIHRSYDTPEAKKRAQLSYEEALPWHLEDFDNKNTWVGNYEEALSERHVMFITEESGFRMVPLEKWYRFIQKGKAESLDWKEIDQLEERRKKGLEAPRWILETHKVKMEKQQAEQKRGGRGLFMRSGGRFDEEKQIKKGDDDWIPEMAEYDDIDYNVEEQFADDEEGVNGLFEGDEEETKQTAEKVKREHLAANVFAMNDEDKVWQEEEDAREQEKRQKELEGALRKALLKREKNYDYSFDSDEDLQSDENESEKDDDRKKEEDKNKSKPKETDKIVSGTSSKGTNTPSGRPSKSADAQKSSAPSLKRPGSPNLSEASGNESSRKKPKKKHHAAPAEAGQTSRPMPGATDVGSRKPSVHGIAGPGSDSEATDSSKTQRLKLRLGGSPNGTPSGSRAGSPAPGTAPAPGTSRAASPTGPIQRLRPGPPPSPEEIRSRIPAGGILLQQLIGHFKGRIDDKNKFIASVKTVATYHKDSKMLKPKGSA